MPREDAPDITQVVTSNNAAGVITFRITTVAPIIDSSLIGIDLDTDSNPGTGGGGFEYGLIAGTEGFGMLKWNGSDFVDAAAPSLSMTRSGNVVEFKLNRADIGNVSRFGFDVFTVNFDAADAYLGEDDAPDGGAYTYTLALTQCANGKDDDGDGKIDGNGHRLHLADRQPRARRQGDAEGRASPSRCRRSRRRARWSSSERR